MIMAEKKKKVTATKEVVEPIKECPAKELLEEKQALEQETPIEGEKPKKKFQFRLPWQRVDEEEVRLAFEDKTKPGPYDDKYVSLVNINKVYDNKFHAVHNFNLDIKRQEFVVFVGPSGCGKSTTLRMIAGLEDISTGDLYINGVRSNDLLSKDRDIAMVFQNYALYPNMTIYNNLAFSLKVRHFSKDLIKQKVTEAAKILEIEDQLKKKPKELSGGQRQRVALGRAIVRNPRIFLMDEPLSNLDAKLRVQMRSEIIKLHKQLKATTIYVTHDQTEAMTMADRIVVMKLGIVQQIDSPREIYRHPANLFVASFIGSPAMNLINGEYDNGKVLFPDGTIFPLTKSEVEAHDVFYRQKYSEESRGLPAYLEKLDMEHEEFMSKHHTPKDKKEFEAKYQKMKEDKQELVKELDKIIHGAKHEVIFGIRPENIIETTADDKDAMKIDVKLSELLGDQYYVHFDFGGKNVLSKVLTEKTINIGTKMNLKIEKGKVHLFDKESTNTIF